MNVITESNNMIKEINNEEIVQKDQKLKGLGGWLVLVILGLFASALYQIHGIYTDINLFTNGTITFLSDSSSQVYIPGFSGALKFELIAQILFLVSAIYLIYLFFRKSSKFSKYYVLYLVAFAIYAILAYIITSSLSISYEGIRETVEAALSEQASQVGRVIISALIWGLYMKKSKRVKMTFVES